MTFPVFASGDVLNASDMNGVGLWLVKSQAVGSGVSSVVVTGAFSADYDNYRIIYAGGVSSASVTNISLKLGASATGYYSSTFFAGVGSATVANAGVNNGAVWTYGGLATTTSTSMDFDLMNPFLAKTTVFANGTYTDTATFGTTNGVHSVATSYTEFTIAPGSGTLTGGTIRVYGYRN
jgi:hypothetical protein